MTVSLRQAQLRLADLLARSARGEEVIIAGEDGQQVRLMPTTSNALGFAPGFLKGKIEIVSDDDEHLKDVAEYM